MSSTSRLDSYLNALKQGSKNFFPFYPLYNIAQQKLKKKLESLTFTWTQKHTHTHTNNITRISKESSSSSLMLIVEHFCAILTTT